MNLRIVTDSTCDLPEEIITRHDIQVVPLYIHMGSETHLDGVDISKDEFYRRLPDYDPAPQNRCTRPRNVPRRL
jgi:fatty acid-binding protein DegV